MEPAGTGVAVLVIGDEILSGKKEDVNGRFFIQEFRELGMPLRGMFIIPDDDDVIVEWVRALRTRFEFLLTCGGVGPTHDDRTIPAVARALGRRLYRDPVVEQAILDLYPGPKTDDVMRMADLPEGTVLIWEGELRIPVIRIENILVFPGEPAILRRKFRAIREMFRSEPFHLRRIFLKSDEGEIASLLRRVQDAHPGVTVGSYPEMDNPRYLVQITVESKARPAVDRAVESILSGVQSHQIVEVL